MYDIYEKNKLKGDTYKRKNNITYYIRIQERKNLVLIFPK